ncbi:MAG5150 family histidine triad lipoprotein [Mycoplasmopsis columbinasalis]|uniref:Lipoprotein n=1 Tax=Mycoplasmopsis columbinasalis TaxID=114880 RepID=A0A449B9G3_9BACT|nr:hypothetical protein [Mycoplasmopsis columbinasalis]VEU77821.1 Uncharacterised protein [Mycoplasmopsis columbinasalis]
MKKYSKFILLPLLALSPVTLTVACSKSETETKTTSSTTESTTPESTVQNWSFTTKEQARQALQTYYQQMKENFTYKVKNGSTAAFETYQNSAQTSALVNLEAALRLIFADKELFDQDRPDADLATNFNLFSEFQKIQTNKLQTLELDPQVRQYFVGNNQQQGTFFEILNVLDAFARDLKAQIHTDSIDIHNFLNSDTLNASRVLQALQTEQTITQAKWQDNIKFDFQTVASKIANLTPSDWNRTEANYQLITYSNQNDQAAQNNHHHSHALGNMVYEFYLILNAIKNTKTTFLTHKNALLQQISDADTKAELEKVFTKYEQLADFSDLQLFKSYGLAAKTAVETLKTALRAVATVIHLDQASVTAALVDPALADGTSAMTQPTQPQESAASTPSSPESSDQPTHTTTPEETPPVVTPKTQMQIAVSASAEGLGYFPTTMQKLFQKATTKAEILALLQKFIYDQLDSEVLTAQTLTYNDAKSAFVDFDDAVHSRQAKVVLETPTKEFAFTINNAGLNNTYNQSQHEFKSATYNYFWDGDLVIEGIASSPAATNPNEPGLETKISAEVTAQKNFQRPNGRVTKIL